MNPTTQVSTPFSLRSLRYRVIRLRNRRRIGQALKLRYRVFSQEGLIPERLLARRAQMEADCFDRYAAQYGALTTPLFDLAGTIRIILPQQEAETAVVVQRVVDESRDPVLVRGFELPYSEELPVFQSFDGVQHAIASRTRRYAEISRLTVDPRHRKRGVATQLVRFALAECERLEIQTVLLGCAPHHAPFYERFGFTAAGDPIARFHRVRRPSLLMRCELR